MNRAALAAACAEALGPLPGPVLVLSPADPAFEEALVATVRRAGPGDHPVAAVIDFLGEAGRSADRRSLLDEAARRLPGGAPLVVVDHNQPRGWTGRWWAAFLGLLAGRAPRRARYLVAREVQDAGFVVERMGLLDVERVQLVRARWMGSPARAL